MVIDSDLLSIEVVYATPTHQQIIHLQLPTSTTAAQAIVASNILAQYPELQLSNLQIGIYSCRCSLDTVLQNHDRLEIYRPLQVDPKEARRRRVAKKKHQHRV